MKETGMEKQQKEQINMKTICIYHSVDLDGWMSAAIVKKWFLERNPYCFVNKCAIDDAIGSVNVVDASHYKEDVNKDGGEDQPTLDMLGWNYGDEIPNLSGYQDVFMADISFPPGIMLEIQKSGKGFIWCDHHISAIKGVKELFAKEDIALPFGLRDTKFAACELTWKECFPSAEMPEIVRLLGRYDCFGHKGTDEEQEVLEFQYGARMLISGYNDAHYNLESWLQNDKAVMDAIPLDGVAIYRYLCSVAKQIYAKRFTITLMEPFVGPMGSGSSPRIFLCVNQERFNPVNFGIDYHADGYDGVACFWYQEGKWHFSLYNDNGQVDCSVIAKGFGGGGHKGAAGFVVDDLKKVIG